MAHDEYFLPKYPDHIRVVAIKIFQLKQSRHEIP